MNKKIVLGFLMALCGSAFAATPTYSLRVSTVGLRVAPPSPAGSLSANAAQVIFGDTTLGDTTSEQRVTFTNKGSDSLTLTNVPDLSGEFQGYGAGNHPCETGETLSPGASCSYWVFFTPATTGARLQAWTLTSTAGAATVQLHGNGLEIPPSLDLLSGPVELGTFVEGTTTGMGAHAYSFKNNSTTPLTAGLVKATTDYPFNSGGIISGNTCVATVAPGGTCSLTFSPTIARPGYLTLSFAESTNLTSVRYVIREETVRMSTKIKSIVGNTLTVEFTNPNTVAATKMLGVKMISNSNYADLSAAFKMTGCAGTGLAPKQSCTMTIEYLPNVGISGTVTAMSYAILPSETVSTAFFLRNGNWW